MKSPSTKLLLLSMLFTGVIATAVDARAAAPAPPFDETQSDAAKPEPTEKNAGKRADKRAEQGDDVSKVEPADNDPIRPGGLLSAILKDSDIDAIDITKDDASLVVDDGLLRALLGPDAREIDRDLALGPVELKVADTARTPLQKLVQRKLLQPLASSDDRRSSFSRVRLPPSERRVRVITANITDVTGRTFARFAIDQRRGWGDEASWKKDVWLGCAYVKTGDIFIKRGDEYRPASYLLGKKTSDLPTSICSAAPELALNAVAQ